MQRDPFPVLISIQVARADLFLVNKMVGFSVVRRGDTAIGNKVVSYVIRFGIAAF